MAKGSKLAEIDAAVAQTVSRGRLTWFDRLPPEAAETLRAAREKFRAGGYGDLPRLTLARILIDYADQNGLKVCDYKRMGEWLAKQG